MSDEDINEMIVMCVESKLAGFDSVSVDPIHIVEMEQHFRGKIASQAETIAKLESDNGLIRAELIAITGKAQECDGWESFPQIYIDDALEALAATNDKEEV